jgi:hypothetical protein
LTGKYRLPPLRPEFIGAFAKVFGQEDFVHRSTFQSHWHGMGAVRKPGFLSRKFISEICTPLLATNTTSWALAADQQPTKPNSRINQRVLFMVLPS